MARLCYSNLNEMIFPLVPKLPKHHWYQGYFYILLVHVVLHCILRCPTTCSTWHRCWCSRAATLHICTLPCTCHNICLWQLWGCIHLHKLIALPPLFPPCTQPFVPYYAVLCSYPCRVLFLSPFVHVYRRTVILNFAPIPPKLCTQYSQNQVPCTFETMYPVPQARSHVPCTLEVINFIRNLTNKLNNPATVKNQGNPWLFIINQIFVVFTFNT